MHILGISAYYHDSGAALIKDGQVVAAAQEERFSRKKHDARFPRAAINFCLEEAGIDAAAIDHVVFYDKPLLKFERLLDTYLTFSPRGFTLCYPVFSRRGRRTGYLFNRFDRSGTRRKKVSYHPGCCRRFNSSHFFGDRKCSFHECLRPSLLDTFRFYPDPHPQE